MKSRRPIIISPDTVPDGASCMPQLGPGQDPITVYTEGDELFEAMLAAIRGAQQKICLEAYILAADAVGCRFAEALAERAGAGVEVRVMVDALGSFLCFPRRLERSLRRSGVKVRRFHRWRWREPWRYNRRDHRKLLVVDGHEAFLGGFNIHQNSSRSVYGEGRWRDTHVRITGVLAAQAETLFDAFWRGDRHRLPVETLGTGSVLLSNHTRACRQRLRCILLAMFADARATLFLTTPYFVPDHRIRQGLRNAAKRGVDVRLLVPRISDVRLARWAANAVYAELLESGVKVYEYLPRLLHAKTVVADGSFALLGTANLDYRSLFLNYELVLASRDLVLCNALWDQFETDLRDSAEVQLEHWRRRHWVMRLAEGVAWGARRWL